MASDTRIFDEGRQGTLGLWDRPPVTGALQEEMDIWIQEGQSRYDHSRIVFWGEDTQRYPEASTKT